eukprot:553237_1
MGCVQQNRSGASIIDFTGDNNDHEMIKEHHNIATVRQDRITMQNNIKVTIIYVDDGLLPKQKIENKIELISGLFYTKIDFNDELQITFNSNDFINYLNNNITTKNPYFADIKYNNKKYNHMIEYKTNINQTKSTKCFTN